MINLVVNSNVLEDNSEFKSRLAKVQFWRNSALVNDKFLDSAYIDGTPVLIRFPCEESDDYKCRKQATSLRNYCSSIVTKYLTAVFRHDPTRAPSDVTDRLLGNADGSGQPLNRFMHDALYAAAVDGISVITVASNDYTQEDIESLSAAQLEALGEENVLQLVKSDSIVHYKKLNNKLVELLILLENEKGLFVRLYTPTDIQEAQVEMNSNLEIKVVSVSDPVPHNFDQIPAVLVEPVPGSSHISAIAELQRSIINKLSLLNAEIADHTFTRFVLSGIDIPANEKDGQPGALTWGHRRIWAFSEPGVKVDKLGSDTAQAASIRDTIAEDEKALYRAAGVGASYQIDGQQQSGVSRLIALEDFSILAGNLADAIEYADNYIVELLHQAESIEYMPTVYSRDFLETNYSEEVQRLRDVLELLPEADPRRDTLITAFIEKHFEVEN